MFFVELACSNDFMLSMEAYTVVEYCENIIDEDTLTKALLITKNAKSTHAAILEDLKNNITLRIS